MIQILYNGKIYTHVKERTHVSALAILHGTMIAYGSDDEILSQFKHQCNNHESGTSNDPSRVDRRPYSSIPICA